MNVLVVGGTGVIGTGITKRLMERGARVTSFDRGHAERAPREVERIHGDRSSAKSFEDAFAKSRFDVVIDLLCFTPNDAESTERAFGGRCEHLIFCSTVCTYGPKVPPSVFVDERFPQEPVSTYGRNKLVCEHILRRASERKRFHLTIVRPSHTYGPGAPLIDQLELDGVAWDRIARGRPVLCAGDGLGLWQSTHRDDCGKLFAHAALNSNAYDRAYNATRDAVVTWREYYRQAAAALGTEARLVLSPAGWLVRKCPDRFRLLSDVTRFHGAYTSAKAMTEIPEFRPTIDFEDGARETFADMRSRGAWRDSSTDGQYERLVNEAMERGFEVITA